MSIYTYNEYLSNPYFNRNKYLIDPQLIPANPQNKLYFQSIDVWETDYNEYNILLYGVLTNGQKTQVIIRNVPTEFDVQITVDFTQPIEPQIDKQYQQIGTLLGEEIKIKTCKFIPEQKSFKGFSEPLQWLRLGFHHLKDRISAIDLLNKSNYLTAWDDGGRFRAPNNGYPLKVARENDIALCGWNEITDYKVIEDGFPTILEVDYTAIKSAPDYKQQSPSVVGYCDTEDNSSLGGGYLSNPEIPDDDMFIITTSFYRPTEKKLLDNLTICHFKGYSAEQLKTMIKPNTKDIIICCANEYEMLDIFIHVYSAVLPDFWIDFNGLDFDQKYFYFRLKKYAVPNKYWSLGPKGGLRVTEDYSAAIKDRLYRPIPYTLLDKFYNAMDQPFATYKMEKSFFRYTKPDEPFSHNWVQQRIKISAEKMVNGRNLLIAGMMYIDSKVVLMKKYTKESSSSLKHFLNLMDLPPKKDMPANAMFALFKNAGTPATVAGTSYSLQDLIDYASWDAESIHAMFLKQNIFVDNMAEAILTKISLYDSFYRAGGMKGRNMLMAKGFFGTLDFNGKLMPVAFSVKDFTDSEDLPDETNAGGHVVDPKYTKLGRTDYPVAPLDFASLYPSIMMAYNVCHETMIRDEREAKALSHKYKIRETPYMLLEGEKRDVEKHRKVWIVQYRFANDDSNIETNDNSNTTTNDSYIQNQENMKPGNEWGMGVMPTVLSQLKKERDVKKANLKIIGEKIDERRKQKLPTDDLEFEASVEDGIQKAIKVQMNTFYGECGNRNSPFYFVDIAAAITAIGRESLKFVISIAESKGFYVHYGDTDSVYSNASPDIYREILAWHHLAEQDLKEGRRPTPPELMDRKIADWAVKTSKNPLAMYPPWCIEITKNGDKVTKKAIGAENDMHPDIFNDSVDLPTKLRRLKEELYRRMVLLAQFAVIGLEKLVNNELIKLTRTRRLSTAYEEVLYPVAFLGKKKYVGAQNVKPDCQLIGFDWLNDAHYFIRGIDFIKKGMPPIMKTIGEEIIAKFLDIMEVRSVRTVVEEELRKFPTRKWNFEDFIKTAEYKPQKKNIAVHNFVAKMRLENEKDPLLYHVPDAGERFKFVYIKLTNNVSKYGRRINISASDQMQYPDVAEKLGQSIDLDKYMNGTFKGLLARFISYDNEFRRKEITPAATTTTDDTHDDDDTESVNSEVQEFESIDDKHAINLAQKSISKLIKEVFSSNAMSLAEIKKSVKLHFKNIAEHLPGYMQFAYEAYKTYLMEIDKSSSTHKAIPQTINILLDSANGHAGKLKINMPAIIEGFTRAGYTGKKIYEIFHGRKAGRNLLALRQKIIEAEKARLTSQLGAINMDSFESNLDKLNVFIKSFEGFVDLYNQLVWVCFQTRVSIAIGNEAVKLRSK